MLNYVRLYVMILLLKFILVYPLESSRGMFRYPFWNVMLLLFSRSFLLPKLGAYVYFYRECGERMVFMGTANVVSRSEWSVFELIDMFNVVVPFATEQKEEPENYEDYLRKGERISTLLLERLNSDTRNFKKRPFLDVLNFKTYSGYSDCNEKALYLLKQVRNQFLRPYVEGLGMGDLDGFLSQFSALGDFITMQDADEYSVDIARSVFLRVDDIGKVVSLKTKGFDHDLVVPTGLTGSQIAKLKGCSMYMKRKKGSPVVYVADAADVYAILAIFSQLWVIVRDMFSGLDEEELSDHPLYLFLKQSLSDSCSSRMIKGDGVVYLHESELQPYLVSYFQDNGISYHVLKKEEYRDLNQLERSAMYSSVSFGAILFLKEALDTNELAMKMTNVRMFRKNCRSCLNCGLSLPFLVSLIDRVFFEYQEDKRDWELAEGLSREYAKSFETKRNIPKKVLKAMQESPFNRYFGYVEYDEDTDLSVMEELYRQFEALAKFIGLKKHEEVSLRFRRLGNHKAAGLYYYVMKSLCVDLRYPSSFAHEMMHMLDYEHGKVSRGALFETTLMLYREAFEREVQKDATVRSQMNGRGKYNREYYLSSSEVFARCGEIYLTRICGVNNSVVKPDESACGFAYPRDQRLEESIKQFFDQFLRIDSTYAEAV